MPEGPTIVILKEEVAAFKGKKVVSAGGNSQKIDFGLLKNKTITDFKSFGKNFLICFPRFTVRIHFMLFGSYRINGEKSTAPRLSLTFAGGKQLNFYACVVELITTPLDERYDWTADVMNPSWDARKALGKLKERPDMLVCDALLDQGIFAGVGNIITNEVLFRTRIDPRSAVGKIPAAKKKELIAEAVRYSFEFLVWKKEYTLKKHWLAHNKKICPRDKVPFVKAYLGKTNRRSFFCPLCQRLY
jgi:endonuclease-8